MNYVKEYGIKQGYVKGKQKWFIMMDGHKVNLSYSLKEFALRKAEIFIKACYKNFTRLDGEKVTFTFKQIDY
jgi:hypothetical protein